MIEFTPWPKIARLNRGMVVTEKIDGTNAAVVITPVSELVPVEGIFTSDESRLSYAMHWVDRGVTAWATVDGTSYAVSAQSRTRLITPAEDNHGFAKWVSENPHDLARVLGPGRHFGEWWGSGIGRGYGLPKGEKRFSLFNTLRWDRWVLTARNAPLGLDVVPVLYEGPFSSPRVNDVLHWLDDRGSHAAPGFMRPEGVVVYHTAANIMFKVTLERDEAPKALALAREAAA